MKELEYADRYPHLAVGKVLIWPNPILDIKAEKVTDDFDHEELIWVIDHMLEILHKNPHAVGLAAPQVGVSLRIFVMQLDGEDHVFVNPTWEPAEAAKKEELLEACLSFPGIVEKVQRWDHVKINSESLEFTRNMFGGVATAHFKGMAAQCVQHETEHLDGVTLYTNLGTVNRDILRRKMRKFGRRKTRHG